ncbi:MAG: hypothetical protein FWE88_09485 [Phycisphaerae bacterium]|nr:hypothetical protein [Phycisphaerae bacterium]
MKRSIFSAVLLMTIWSGIACSEPTAVSTNSSGNQSTAAVPLSDTKGTKDMNSEKVLQGVPKAYYGAGGVTPFPICLKSDLRHRHGLPDPEHQ